MDINNPTNIIDESGATIQRNNEEFEKFGFKWRIGRSWGLAHPDDICYADGGVVQVFENEIRLGLEYKPAYFTPDQKKLYNWGIGYVSSLQSFKYGALKVKFILPGGNHLWPAIWVYDCETWPPEIDIVEAWTNDISEKKCYRKEWNGILLPFTNDIFPSFHLGDCPENHQSKSYRNLFKGSCSSRLDTDLGINECELQWTSDYIRIYWNGHKMVDESDKEILSWFNRSNGMQIHLNNYISNQFSHNDFAKLAGDETSCLRILDVQYIK